MERASKRLALDPRAWRMPEQLAKPTPATPAPTPSRVPAPPPTPTPFVPGCLQDATPFSRRLTCSYFGSSGGGSGSASTRPSGARIPRSRLASSATTDTADDIDSGSDDDNTGPPAPVFPGFPLTDPAGPGRALADGAPRRSSFGSGSGLVSGLSLSTDQIGAALPASSSRGGGGGRRPPGPLGLLAQRALLGVEADRSMLNAKHGLGGLAPLCADRLRHALSAPGLAPLLLRAAVASDRTQPLVALACEQLHPRAAGAADRPQPGGGAAVITVLLQRQALEKLRLSSAGAGAGAGAVDLWILILPPWIEHEGMILAHHCQGVAACAVERAQSSGGSGYI